jgi:hypothetical protein
MAVRYNRGNKYHAKKDFRNSNGETVKFDSRKEARRYDELRLLERAHQISELQRQVKFVLIPAQRDPKGKLIERQCYYVADFTYKDSSGRLVVEDTKSEATRTPVYVLKRKLMLWVHGIRVREI